MVLGDCGEPGRLVKPADERQDLPPLIKVDLNMSKYHVEVTQPGREMTLWRLFLPGARSFGEFLQRASSQVLSALPTGRHSRRTAGTGCPSVPQIQRCTDHGKIHTYLLVLNKRGTRMLPMEEIGVI
jgi:hypothetical protein